jgi:hypothetical protein
MVLDFFSKFIEILHLQAYHFKPQVFVWILC